MGECSGSIATVIRKCVSGVACQTVSFLVGEGARGFLLSHETGCVGIYFAVLGVTELGYSKSAIFGV